MTAKGEWTEAAVKVLEERYLLRDANGKLMETPDDMCWRVARAIADAERTWSVHPEEIDRIAGRYAAMMRNLLFLPNSPTLMNAGKNNGLQYSACFVLEVPDSIEGIFEAVKRAALIHKSGGGTGFAFSRLRSKNSLVQRTGGLASGPVSFMKVFDSATDAIKQGGRRRGANMGVLRVDHPDILEFIDCKLSGEVTNFNISVGITDEFMLALAGGRSYKLTDHLGHDAGSLEARNVFDRIVAAAWQTGDPGLVFLDRINRSHANPTPTIGMVEATNPCGEVPLLSNEPCNLGSINLGRHVSPDNLIDWNALENTVRLSTYFLDDLIEVNPYPLPEIDAMAKANRRIGLGVMGWADTLIKLGIPYTSDRALALADEVMHFIWEVGHDTSVSLAEERGPFPNWAISIYKDGAPIRNSTVTTIAPTGSISVLAGASSGVEPLFALGYTHNNQLGRQLTIMNPYFFSKMADLGYANLAEEVAAAGSFHTYTEALPEDLLSKVELFQTAHEIAPEWHVRMQAAFQRWTDNGVSKTVNMPNHATEADIAHVYKKAYELDCLGVTVFRDGCKAAQVLTIGTGKPEKPSEPEAKSITTSTEMKPRPTVVAGRTHRTVTPLGTAYVTVNRNGGDAPFEVFLNVGKAGSDTAAVAEAIGRLISMVLRLPSPVSPDERLEAVIEQLTGIGASRQMGFGKSKVKSLPDAIARALSDDILQVTAKDVAHSEALAQDLPPTPVFFGDLCPSCGHASFVHEDGCSKCYSCGYSEC